VAPQPSRPAANGDQADDQSGTDRGLEGLFWKEGALMPIVQMPDGTQVNFPDTMSETSIRGLIAQKFPKEVGEAGAAKPMSERNTTGHYAFDESKFAPSVGEDVLRSIPSGFRSGAESLVGGFGDVGKYQDAIAQWGAKKLGASPATAQTLGSVARRLTGIPFAATTDDIQGLTNPVAGQAYEAKTTAGKYANTAASFLPAALLPNGQAGIVQRVLEQAVLPGLASEGGGQLAQKLSADGRLPAGAEPYARILGAVAGGLAPSALRRAVTPFPNSRSAKLWRRPWLARAWTSRQGSARAARRSATSKAN
jgi:hypothetical protein